MGSIEPTRPAVTDLQQRVELLSQQAYTAELECCAGDNDPPLVRWRESVKQDLEEAEKELAHSKEHTFRSPH